MFSFLSINMYCKIFLPHSYIHYHSTRWLVTVRRIRTRKGMQNERHPRCWEIISRVLQSLEGGKGGKGRGKGGNQHHYTTTCWEKNPGYLRSPPSEVFLVVVLSSMKLFLVNVITPSSGLKNLSLKRIVHVTKLKSPLVQL